MKRIITTIISVALLFSSCSEELVQEPITDKVSEKFYNNEKEIEEAVNAVYATLQFKSNFNTGIPAIGEIPGEDAYDATPANDGGIYGQLDDFNVIPQNGLIGNTWRDAYKGIQRANIVINRITKIPFKKEETKSARIGEMKFIRALYYFYLVRIYGDVPLVIEEVKNPQDFFSQTRTVKAEVYNQIKKDLNDAIVKLPNRSEKNKKRIVKTAAQTLLAKVELTLKNYAEAKTQLLNVVNSKAHFLLSDVEKIFAVDNELNEEIIFAVQYSSGLNSNSEGSDAYRMFNPTGRVIGSLRGTKGHGVLKEDFYKLYSSTDNRKDVYVKVLGSGEAYNNKIAPPTTTISDSGSDWVVLRYADVILMLAEIENQENNQSQALTYLNQIRKRAGLSDFTDTNKDAVFNEIDLQRRLELVWEGHRWFDLIRQERTESVLGITNKNKLLMPIPASQAVMGLTQNPGY